METGSYLSDNRETLLVVAGVAALLGALTASWAAETARVVCQAVLRLAGVLVVVAVAWLLLLRGDDRPRARDPAEAPTTATAEPPPSGSAPNSSKPPEDVWWQ